MESCPISVSYSLFLKYLIDDLSSPRNAKELFNQRHASARNVVERIFGILKQCFRILQLPPEYAMEIQSLIPPALAALHNFIRQYDPDEIDIDNNYTLNFQADHDSQSVGELGRGPPTL